MEENVFSGFWSYLPKPFFALAPMEDVTDTVFRQRILDISRPHVFYTEFVMASGIVQGRKESMRRLRYEQEEKPLVAQIWGNNPSDYLKAIRVIRKSGFSGVDLNFGCPQAKIVNKGCCAALIKNPSLALELIKAAQEASQEDLGPQYPKIPLSIKTRVSFNLEPKQKNVESWFTLLLETKPAALCIHGRSAEQQSEGFASWEWVRLCVELKNLISPKTQVIGNGDITSIEHGINRYKETLCDGLMLGRGIFSNPAAFASLNESYHEPINQIEIKKRNLLWILKHLDLYKNTWGQEKNYEILKKFYKIYTSGFEGDLELRAALMETHNYEAATELLLNILATIPEQDLS